MVYHFTVRQSVLLTHICGTAVVLNYCTAKAYLGMCEHINDMLTKLFFVIEVCIPKF